LANGYRILNEEQRIRLNIVVMCRSARMGIVDIRELLSGGVTISNLLKIQMIIAEAKMREYWRMFSSIEDLYEKYEKINEESRISI
jgi:DNA-binding transcriptional MerR regulator